MHPVTALILELTGQLIVLEPGVKKASINESPIQVWLSTKATENYLVIMLCFLYKGQMCLLFGGLRKYP